MFANPLMWNMSSVSIPAERPSPETNKSAKFSVRQQTSNKQSHAVYLIKHHQSDDEKQQLLVADINESINRQAGRQINASRKIPRNLNNWLEAALTELADCREEALDEGIEVPPEISFHNAKSLIEHISSFIEEQPDIYPMDEGSIAIDFRNPSMRSGIFILVDGDGSGALFTRSNESKGRIRVSDAKRLLNENLKSTFKRFGIS